MFARASMLVLSFLFAGLASFAQSEFPQPVSEYVEKTGPTTMTFLSYPKYYRNAENQLTEVDTTLRESDIPGWDYEVTTGIWTLRVRKDGTYQAEHEGDVFTYRLSDLGIGRGTEFESLKLGEPDWGRFSVLGDRIRWADVFPDVDFEVRYIHDIMKVDVIVKQNRLKEISASHTDGYLTAKFDIPSVLVRSEAKQGGKAYDLYAEEVEFNQSPIELMRDGRVLHTLKPTEIYFLDEMGQPKVNGIDAKFRLAQRWKLNPDTSGEAELSVHLSDIAGEQGDLVIDPPIIFSGEGFYGGGDIYDAMISSFNPSSTYGTSSYLMLEGPSSEIRTLVGVAHSSQKLAGKNIISAKLEMYAYSAVNATGNETARAYKNTHGWYMSTVTWNNDGFGSSWSGGSYTNDFQSPPATLPASSGNWVTFDITQAFKSHYSTSTAHPGDRGFLLKVDTTSSAYWYFYSTEYTNADYRPKVTVECAATQFGAYPGPTNISQSLSLRIADAYTDNYELIRFLYEPYPGITHSQLSTMVSTSTQSNQKIFVSSPVGSQVGVWYSSASNYGSDIGNLLDYNSTVQNAISSKKLNAIEIGGEEENKDVWWEPGFTPIHWYNGIPIWYGNEANGQAFAQYYINARSEIESLNNGIEVMAPTIERHTSFFNDPSGDTGNAKYFIRGFLKEVKNNSVGGFDWLPETLTIHNYQGKFSPEGGNQGLNTPWFDRLQQLVDICTASDIGFFPNFAATEYGYSAAAGSFISDGLTSLDQRKVVQALYYERDVLINSTMRASNGIGWKYFSRFAHHEGVIGDNDFGFRDDDFNNNTLGPKRGIKDVANILFDDLRIMDPDMSVWLPVDRNEPVSAGQDGTAWCGWQVNDLTNPNVTYKYLAVWRFVYDEVFYNGDDTPNSEFESRSITVPGNLEGVTNDIKWISISPSSASYTTSFGGLTPSLNATNNGSNTDLTIYPVSVWPVIIKFTIQN